MARICFRSQVNPALLEAYAAAHATVWPEMLEALKEAGISNYNIFRHGLTLFGYFETDDLEATKAFLRTNAVDQRWGKWMAPIMKIEIDPTTQFPYLLPKQFFMA